MTDRVLIFDTTLRDGEQAPGFAMGPADKLRMGSQLAELGVDILEAGFPAASPDEFAAVRQLAQELRHGPVIAALARTGLADIDRAGEAVAPARRSRIHAFIATSDLHLTAKLRMTRAQVICSVEAAVERALKYTDDVQIGFEDATRADPDFLCLLTEAAIAAGARTIDIADTVGYITPWELEALIARLYERTPALHHAVVSVHCHDDHGLAVANSLAGIRAGARQVDCTVNGIGERAGNASLEEIVMALHNRRSVFGVRTGVVREKLYPTSRLLEEITGIPVQPNKAIVGSNAFAHEAGIHQHGVLVNPLTYEVMRPASVGVPCNQLVLGKHSGRHALRQRLEELGVEIPGGDLAFDAFFERFKVFSDTHKRVTGEDLRRLASDPTALSRLASG